MLFSTCLLKCQLKHNTVCIVLFKFKSKDHFCEFHFNYFFKHFILDGQTRNVKYKKGNLKVKCCTHKKRGEIRNLILVLKFSVQFLKKQSTHFTCWIGHISKISGSQPFCAHVPPNIKISPGLLKLS